MAAEEDGLNAELIKQLECPVCLETCLPPIKMCVLTHIVCSKCSAGLVSCPTCRQRMATKRNFFAESLCSKVTLPCRNSGDGCDEKLNVNNFETHLRKCRFKNYQCHNLTMHKGPLTSLFLRCNWGGPLHNLYSHVQNEHDHQLHESSLPLKFTNQLHYRKRPYCVLLYAEGHHFWFKQNTYNDDKKELELAVLYAGPDESAANFHYKLEIGQKGANALKFSSETVPVARLDESKGKLCVLSEHFLKILSICEILSVSLVVYEETK